MPFHDNTGVAGVTEPCKYNDHELCRSASCACSCHVAPIAVEEAIPAQGDPRTMKTCPQCNVKRPAYERFCRECGSKLGSLLCMACGQVGEPGDKYCWACGCPVGKGMREVAKEVPTTGIVEGEVAGLTNEAVRARLKAKAQGNGERGVEGEKSWELPQGSFKVSNKGPVAGKPSGANTLPFNPHTKDPV